MAQEGRDTLEAQIELAPQQYAATARYQPLYTDLDVQNLRRALLGNGTDPGLLQTYSDIAPQLNEFNRTAASGQRAADIGDVETLAPRATAALRAANPEAARLEMELLRQAEEGLGGSLDPRVVAEIQQDVRGGQAARGFGMGLPDANVEALFTGRERIAQRDRNRTFAQGVLAQSRAGTADPFMAILGRPSGTAQMAGGVVGQGGAFGAGAPTFDPWSAYGADLHNTNFNAASSNAIADANNTNALIGAGISSAGSVAGSM